MDTAEHVNMTVAMLRLQARQAPANDPKACSVSEDGANIIEAQAAEIERLEAEINDLNNFLDDAQKVQENFEADVKRLKAELDEALEGKRSFAQALKVRRKQNADQQAQLAEMRGALEDAERRCAGMVGGAGDLVHEALATDAGKTAADVLAAAVAWGEYAAPPLDGHSEQYRNLYNAVRAHRKKGRDDA